MPLGPRMTFEINIHTRLFFTSVITLCWYSPQTAINTLFLTQRLVLFVQEFIDFLSFYFCVYFVTIVILVFRLVSCLHPFTRHKNTHTRVLTTTEPRLSFFSTKHQICNRKRASQWLFNRSPLYTLLLICMSIQMDILKKLYFPFFVVK